MNERNAADLMSATFAGFSVAGTRSLRGVSPRLVDFQARGETIRGRAYGGRMGIAGEGREMPDYSVTVFVGTAADVRKRMRGIRRLMAAGYAHIPVTP